MKQQNVLVTQSNNLPKDVNLENISDGYSPVGIILAVTFLIGTLTGAITKLIQVLVPVMMKDRNSK